MVSKSAFIGVDLQLLCINQPYLIRPLVCRNNRFGQSDSSNVLKYFLSFVDKIFDILQLQNCNCSKCTAGSPHHPNEPNYLHCTRSVQTPLTEQPFWSLFVKSFSLIQKKLDRLRGYTFIWLGSVDTERRKSLSGFVINSRTVYHTSWQYQNSKHSEINSLGFTIMLIVNI